MSNEQLRDIASQIEATGKPRRMTVRRLLAAIGQERRGKHVTRQLRILLKRNRLKCEPDFENTHIDAHVVLTLGPRLGRPPKTRDDGGCTTELAGEEPEDETDAVSEDGEAGVHPSPTGSAPEDESDTVIPPQERPAPPPIAVAISLPAEEIEAREVVITVRQGVPAGGRIPVMIRRQEQVFRALSQMNDANLTQLVVTNGERGMVEGIFSWQSYGKAMLAGKRCETVADCLSRDFGEVREDKPLFDAVREVIRHGTVVVRARDGCLCGLVNLRDVADTFLELSEPFLFLGQIENHLRELVERMRLSQDQLRALADQRDSGRAARVARVDDFSLGELIRAIENPEYWARLGLNHDRGIILQRLDRVRTIRNKVMHFDADGISPADKTFLTDTRRILQEL